MILFLETFLKSFGNAKGMKSSFSKLQQWWDFVKVQIKQLCLQYTHNARKEINSSMSVLQEDLIKLDELSESTKICNLYGEHKKKIVY